MKKKTKLENPVLIHASLKENRGSIIRNGLYASQNPILINGIYTFPEGRGHLKKLFNKNDYDFYAITLKPTSIVYWTEASRPLDFVLGNCGVKVIDVWKYILRGTFLRSRKEILLAEKNKELWLDWKSEFSRSAEKYLIDNNYSCIQQGGEFVITNLDAIDSIFLIQNPPIKIKVSYFKFKSSKITETGLV
jgi:hypothetical protein